MPILYTHAKYDQNSRKIYLYDRTYQDALTLGKLLNLVTNWEKDFLSFFKHKGDFTDVAILEPNVAVIKSCFVYIAGLIVDFFRTKF